MYQADAKNPKGLIPVPDTQGREQFSPSARERAAQRTRRAMASTLSSAGAKLTTVAISFATIPVTSNYLGTEQFGVWMTLSSLSAFFAVAELGVGPSSKGVGL